MEGGAGGWVGGWGKEVGERREKEDNEGREGRGR